MFPRWSKAGLAVSIALCVATLLLWVRSYFYADLVRSGNVQRSFFLVAQSYRGTLSFNLMTTNNLPANLRARLMMSAGWQSRPVPGAWVITFGSLFDFNWRFRVLPIGTNGGNVRLAALTIPTWTLFIVWAPFPIWIFFRGRRSVQWKFRKDVLWISPRLLSRIVRFAVFSVIGCILGALVGWADIEFDLSRTQGQWTVTLFGLIPVVVLMAVFTRRRIPWHRAILWMALELAGCVCFMEATVDRMWIWSHTHQFDGLEQLEMILYVGLFCFILGAVLLLFLQVKPEPAKPGPYCPECGYCLIGLPRQICSECGRPFTLDELGIGADALVPRNVSPT